MSSWPKIAALKKQQTTGQQPSEVDSGTEKKGRRSVGILPMKLLSSSNLMHLGLELEAGEETQTTTRRR